VADRRPPPLPVIGRLFEPVYRAVLARRNAAFDAGRGVTRFGVPVISIGNLSVGGTGKTPLVMHVLRVLLEAGHRPCVAMRGYSQGGAPDETDAYARAFPGVPVVAQPDRAAGLRELLVNAPAAQRPDCVVLDDGFQHRRIARQVDGVLIDATPGRSVFEDRCLPAGWLREPVENLERATAVVLTHAELADAESLGRLREKVGRVSSAPVAVTRHVWTGLVGRTDGEDRMAPLDTLVGRRVVGCCAIGHPEGFRRSLAVTLGAIPQVVVLPDHDPYRERTVRRLVEMAAAARAEFIVVTDKDWSKLRRVPEATWPCPVVRPQLAMVFDAGREEFDRLVVGAAARSKGVS